MNKKITAVEEKPVCGIDQWDKLKKQIEEEDWLPFLLWGDAEFLLKFDKGGGKLSKRDECLLQLLIQSLISAYLKATGKKKFDYIPPRIIKEVMKMDLEMTK
jgi:hypothetical protein